jgi:hypothetical protein
MELTDEHKQKLREARSRSVRPILNVSNLVDGDRGYGDYASRSYAIQNHCLGCMGGDSTARRYVRECEIYECWLWPWRVGKMTEDQNEHIEREWKPWRNR